VWEGKDQIVRSQGRPSTETVGFGSSAVRGPPGTATIAAAGGSVNRKGSDRGCPWALNKERTIRNRSQVTGVVVPGHLAGRAARSAAEGAHSLIRASSGGTFERQANTGVCRAGPLANWPFAVHPFGAFEG